MVGVVMARVVAVMGATVVAEPMGAAVTVLVAAAMAVAARMVAHVSGPNCWGRCRTPP